MIKTPAVPLLSLLAVSGLLIATQTNHSNETTAVAAQPSNNTNTHEESVSSTATGDNKRTHASMTQQSGRQAYIDPETGELTSEVPTEVLENNQTNQINSDRTQGNIVEPELEVIDHPNGMQEIRLNGHMDSHYDVELDCANNVVNNHTGDHHNSASDCDQ